MNYKEYITDIKFARDEMKKMKLYPTNIIADFYCIPSHNHQAYYALLSKDNSGYKINYIKSLIYEIELDIPIKMYPFAWCKQAEKHPAKQGQFIIGITKVSNKFAENLIQMINVLPDKYFLKPDGIHLDDVFQAIRLYGDNSKEILYYDAKEIENLSKEQSEYFDSLYIEIEKIIKN